MEKNKLVSISSEPAGELKSLLAYDRKMAPVTDFVHCDIMDGKFVGRTLFDFEMLSEYSKKAKNKLDMHLMCENQKEKYADYIALKPAILTIHYEAFENKKELVKTLKSFKKEGIKAGLSVLLKTDIEEVLPVLKHVDVLLIMSVEIGKSGQAFNESAYNKISKAKAFIGLNNLKTLIEVDGGVNDKNCEKLKKSGASILVSGSFVYENKNQKEAVKILKK